MPMLNEDDFEVLSLENFKVQRKSPFDKLVIDFLNELSRKILRNKQAKFYPDLITFGFFCRRSNILKNKERYEDELALRMGYGLTLHISPSNIPINFAFSFLFGLLSGNSNLVRLPSNKFDQNVLLLEIINTLMREEKYKSIKESNIFFYSDRNSKKLKEILQKADTLIVWGGDETVKEFKKLEKKINCIELFFPNRVSSLLINSKQFIKAKNKNQLLNDFYNDTYLVDQNACSSPTNIFWLGHEQDNKEAQDLFWKELLITLKLKDYSLDTISIMDKYISVLKTINQKNTQLEIKKHHPSIWEIFNIPHYSNSFNLGQFASINMKSLGELPEHMRNNEQTLTYYGLDVESINLVLREAQLCIDRIVPIGSALNIGLIWDGKDIIRLLSKYTEIS